jgi:hypothetical protein
MVHLAACVLAAGLAAFTPSYELGLSSEARARFSSANAPLDATPEELEIVPRAGVRANDHIFSLHLEYNPSFIGSLRDTTFDGRTMHRAGLDASWQLDPDFLLVSQTRGAYGREDFVSLAQQGVLGSGTGDGTGGTSGGNGTGTSGVTPQATTQSFQFKSIDTRAALEYRPSQRWHASTMLSFNASGASGGAEESLPFARGYVFTSSLAWKADPRDALTSSLEGSLTDFSGGTRIWIASGSEAWHHEFGRRTTGWITLGLSATGQPSQGKSASVLPIGEAGFEEQVRIGDRRVTFHLSSLVHAFVDRVEATAYQRLDGMARVTWFGERNWTVDAELSGGSALGQVQSRAASGLGELRVAWTISNQATAAFGVRSLIQGGSGGSFWRWGPFLGLTWDERNRM